MNIFPLWRNLQQGRLTFYSGPSHFHALALSHPLQGPNLPLEYSSHLWRGASKYSLSTLYRIQNRAVRLIDDYALTDSLDSLAHRTNVSALSLFIDTITAGALMS